MRKRTQARECALQILYQREMNLDETPQEILDEYWKQNPDFDEEVRKFAGRLFLGTVDKLDEIDAVLQKAADNWELSRMAIVDKNIMRFGIYELLFCDDIPPKVTINEAVNVAKKFSQEEAGKFVNGVLDKINHSEKPRHSA